MLAVELLALSTPKVAFNRFVVEPWVVWAFISFATSVLLVDGKSLADLVDVGRVTASV
jgi:hypothetical protein